LKWKRSAFITGEYKVTRVTVASSGLLNIVLILRRRKGIHLEVRSIYFEAKYLKFEYALRESKVLANLTAVVITYNTAVISISHLLHLQNMMQFVTVTYI
jgi:hypothetical protein